MKTNLTRLAILLLLSLTTLHAHAQWSGTGDIYYNNGNVGIGTPGPSKKLTIDSGDLLFTGNRSNILSVNGDYTSNKPMFIIGEQQAYGLGFKWDSGLNLDIVQFDNQNIFTSTPTKLGHFRIRDKEFYWSGDVGIGTSSPAAKLDIKSNAGGQETLLRLKVDDAPNDYLNIHNATGVTNQFIPNIYSYRTSDNRAALYVTGSIAQSNDSGTQAIVIFDSRIHNSGPISSRPLFGWDSYGNRKMILSANGNLGIGTTTPSNKLDVAGTIRAEEVKVETGWADYVFHEDYELKSLSEVSTYIRENRHLPGIPTAEEVAENGIKLGEMNAKLLEKIEELTLYLIEMEKENDKQNEKIEAVLKENEEMRRENQRQNKVIENLLNN